jgi:UPF0271 protein
MQPGHRRSIDLNCDMGESFGSFKIGSDAEIVQHITSANLGCGFHGGDPHVMRASVSLCGEHRVAVGAHPGFPDLMGFGRRSMGATPAQVADFVTYQAGAMQAFLKAAGLPMQHVKPHGALYMMALVDDAMSRAIVEAVAAFDPKLMIFTTGGSATERAADRAGVRVAREFFADRPMTQNGWQMFGSKLEDVGGTPERIAARALDAFTQGRTRALTGPDVAITFDTICVHSDTPGSPAIMRAIRQAFEAAGVRAHDMSR